MLAGDGLFASERGYLLSKCLVVSACFHFEEPAIGPSLFLQIARDCDPAVSDNQNLFTAFLDVAQQMRREQDMGLAAVADFADEVDHSLAGGRVEPVSRLVQKNQSRTVNYSLR